MENTTLSPLDEEFRALYRLQKDCDLIITTEDGQTKQMAHSVVVGAFSRALKAKMVVSEDSKTKVLTVDNEESLLFRFLVKWIYERQYTHLLEYAACVGESRARLNVSIYGLAVKYKVRFLPGYVLSLLEGCWNEKNKGDNGYSMLNLLKSIAPVSDLDLEYEGDPLLVMLFKDYERIFPKFASYRTARRLESMMRLRWIGDATLRDPNPFIKYIPDGVLPTDGSPISLKDYGMVLIENNRRRREKLPPYDLQ